MMNLGTIGRLVRALAGVALLVALFVVEGKARYLGLLGIVPLTVAGVGYCPLYLPFSRNTPPRS